MRVLFCYYYANLGGVTSVIKSRLASLFAEGIEVSACFEKDFGGIADLRAHGLSDVQVTPSVERALPNLLRQAAPDVVVVFDMPEVVAPLKDAGVTVVFEIHTPILKTLMKAAPATLELCDQILVPSEWSRNWVIEALPGAYRPEKIVVAPNIIDRDRFYPPPLGPEEPAGPPTVLWVGKIASDKRWKDAARIAGDVARRTGCEVVMVTGGDCSPAMTEEFLTELSANGLREGVAWLHNLPLDAMAGLYKTCARAGGVLLSTSEAESFCLVAHEAMSCGLPIVAACAGALPELFQGRLRDSMFVPGDLCAAVQKMERLLRSRAAWLDASEAGIRRQAMYSPGVLASRYIDSLRVLARDPADELAPNARASSLALGR